MFKIATWNVNSLRVRQAQLIEWLEQFQPDVMALQETKIQDVDFPVETFANLGYHCLFSGQKTFNGVAILSRQPLCDPLMDLPSFSDPQRRVLYARVGNWQILNLYVPNGASVDSDKYHYKLEWLAKAKQLAQQLLATNPHLILLGDFNIAPEDRDVYDPKAWEGQVLVSDRERQALQSLLCVGLDDALRLHHQESIFSWWDYRQAAFRRNMGLRIDHIFISKALAPQCISCEIDKSARKHERPSDHAPVIACFGSTPNEQ